MEASNPSLLLLRQILSPDCQTQIMNETKQEPENHGNKELMAAVTGALWKLSMSEDNVKCFQVVSLSYHHSIS